MILGDVKRKTALIVVDKLRGAPVAEFIAVIVASLTGRVSVPEFN